MLFKRTTKAVLFAGLVLIGLASAPSFASDDNIQFFPPKNLEAGLGFLYFDAGGIGKQSVYAVPVQSQDLVDEIKKLNEILKKSQSVQCVSLGNTEHTYEYQFTYSSTPVTQRGQDGSDYLVGYTGEAAPPIKKVSDSLPQIMCTNVQTGQACLLNSYNGGWSWSCFQPTNYNMQ